MIIKKLKQVSGGVFPGAAYNETKVEQGVADFAGAANVDGNFLLVLDMLHEAGVNCAHEVEQYLQDHSNTFGNSKSTRLQFHYALSVKGREKSKEQLVEIAHQLMKEFGAEHNPYFIYFHRDTENNHVHILGTRVKPNGTLLSDHQDFRRLNECLNRVGQKDQFQDMNELLSYSFQTEGQLMNIIREFAYDGCFTRFTFQQASTVNNYLLAYSNRKMGANTLILLSRPFITEQGYEKSKPEIHNVANDFGWYERAEQQRIAEEEHQKVEEEQREHQEKQAQERAHQAELERQNVKRVPPRRAPIKQDRPRSRGLHR